MAGHFQTARGRFVVVNSYFPKGSGPARDNSRVGYKLDFSRTVFARAQELRRRGPVLVIGDYNTAHRAIDLARPQANVTHSGFLPEERAELDRWIDAGWVDAFRALHPEAPDQYTWWRQWGGARERNIGWRIDYNGHDVGLECGRPSAPGRLASLVAPVLRLSHTRLGGHDRTDLAHQCPDTSPPSTLIAGAVSVSAILAGRADQPFRHAHLVYDEPQPEGARTLRVRIPRTDSEAR